MPLVRSASFAVLPAWFRRPMMTALFMMVALSATVGLSSCSGGWSGFRPEVLTGPASMTVIAPAAATFSATATGTAPFEYQWTKNGTAIPGATASTYTTPATSGSDNGSLFAVTITDVNGTVTTQSAVLTVNVVPTVVTPPASVTVTAPAVATFNASATGTAPLSYQWYLNGTAITGATGTSYTTAATSNSMNGGVYTVAVTNIAGAVTSAPATLTVDTTPVASGLSCNPAAPAYNTPVMVTPTWSGLSAMIGTEGVNSSDLTASAVSGNGYRSSNLTTAKTFMLTVKGSNGSTATASCTATPQPVTISPIAPANTTLTAVTTQAFTATATGGVTDNVTWSATGGSFSGNVWMTPNTSGTYTITATSVDEPSVSVSTTVTVNVVPTIVTPPASVTVTAPTVATFNVSAAGTAPLSYQWYLNGAPIVGATGASYTTGATSNSLNGGVYTVKVSNVAGSVTSAAAVLTVNTTPVASGLVCSSATPPYNSPVVLMPTWSGLSAVIGTSGAGSSDITASALSGVSYPSPNLTSAKTFTLTVTGSNGQTATASCTATPTTISITPISPANATLNTTTTQTYAATVTGGATDNLTWSATGGSFSGSVWTAPAGSGTYTITATSVDEPSVHVSTTVTVNVAPTITAQPVSQTVSAPATANFSVVASGTAPLSYQWYLNGAPIVGATASSYTTGASSNSLNGGMYTVKVSNVAGNVTSAPATLTVNTTAVASGLVCSSVAPAYNAAITVTPSWSGLSAVIGTSGAGSSDITASALSGVSYPSPNLTSAKTFTLTVTGSNGQTATASCTATPTTISITPISPANATLNTTTTQTYAATVTGGATNNLTWSATGGSFSGSVWTAPAGSGTYTITATSVDEPSVHVSTTVTVNVAPTISLQPASVTELAPDPATFSVAASGTGPLSYQWYLNGSPISGATGSSYTTGATSNTLNNAVYTVKVSNVAGSVMSAGAVLTVTTQPVATGLVCVSTTPAYNAPITLVPSWTGLSAVIGTSGAGSSNITNAAVNDTPYTTPNVTASTTYTLTVTGSNNQTATTSCTAVPTQVSLTPISPANPSLTSNNPMTFASTASGGATDGVTWSSTSGTWSGDVWTPPSTAGTYTITATSVDEPSVHVSTTVTMTLSPPTITSQPVSVNACPNSNVVLSVAANNATGYQWYLNGTAIPGATGETYGIGGAQSSDAGQYTVVVSSSSGNTTSSAATVTVGSTLTTNPQSQSIYTSQVGTFIVAARGKAPFTYQWYEIPPASATGAAISGATSSSYITPAVTSSNNGEGFYATATDSCGTVLTSSTADLTVTAGNVPPTVVTQPQGTAVVAGAGATFTVTASGTPTLSYQWYRIPAGSSSGSAIGGATSATYAVPANLTETNNNQDQYYVIVKNLYGQASSQDGTLVVGNGILIQVNDEPVNQYVSVGQSATFSVTATSTATLTYQWYEAAPGSASFTAISGATSPSYTVTNATTDEYGSTFYVAINNGTTTVKSTTAALYVGPLNGVGDLCNTVWTPHGSATKVTVSGDVNCGFQMTNSFSQAGQLVWPQLIATSNLQLSFTITMSNPSTPPADGFTMTLGDPSQGATPTSIGAQGQGLGAEGIPGFVLGFDTYQNGPPDAPIVPYVGVTRGNSGLFENPWFNYNDNIATIVAVGQVITTNYVINLVNGQMTVTQNGNLIFSGAVSGVPPVAYLYFTASTGGADETLVVSNLTAVVSTP